MCYLTKNLHLKYYKVCLFFGFLLISWQISFVMTRSYIWHSWDLWKQVRNVVAFSVNKKVSVSALWLNVFCLFAERISVAWVMDKDNPRCSLKFFTWSKGYRAHLLVLWKWKAKDIFADLSTCLDKSFPIPFYCVWTYHTDWWRCQYCIPVINRDAINQLAIILATCQLL